MFFDEHPEFLETSVTGIEANRLNVRHRMMIEQHADLLRGKRVLDIASHDGRWSFAALQAGAAHVTGVEGRAELVANANRTFAEKGVDEERFRFEVGDAHDFLAEKPPQVDVVMCLGFLYHTLRYGEIFNGIRATGAQHLLIDTRVLPGVDSRTIKVYRNPVQIQSMAVEDRLTHAGYALAGTPSMKALSLMLDVYGYQVDSVVDWKSEVKRLRREAKARGDKQKLRLEAYASGRRVTFIASRRD